MPIIPVVVAGLVGFLAGNVGQLWLDSSALDAANERISRANLEIGSINARIGELAERINVDPKKVRSMVMLGDNPFARINDESPDPVIKMFDKILFEKQR